VGNAEGVKAKGKRCDSSNNRIRSNSYVVIEDVARERMPDARTTDAKAGTRGGTLEVALETGASEEEAFVCESEKTTRRWLRRKESVVLRRSPLL